MRSLHSALIAIVLLTAACGPSKERIALDSLRSDLDSSTQTIKDGIAQTIGCMTSIAHNPISYQMAIDWMPKAQHLRHATDSCIAILDSMATGRAKASGAFIGKLDVYHKAMQSISTDIPFNMVTITEFSNHLSDTLLQRILLSRIKNEILRAEYATMQYSLRQITPLKSCINYFPQLMINTNRPRRGDTVCIKGWYGMFMPNVNLTLTTRDTTIPQGKNEGIEYKFAAPDAPGPHPLTIKMQYTKPDGTTGIIEKTINYTVRP